MSHLHVLKKLPYCLMCTYVVLWIILCPTDKYMFKVNNNIFSVGCDRQVVVFWIYKERNICFIIKVARPISFSDLSLHRIEISYEHMTILWAYYEHTINICLSSKFALGIRSVLLSLRPVIWSAISSLFPRDLIFFAISNPKSFSISEKNW